MNDYQLVDSIRTSGIRTQTFEIGLNPVPSISTNFDILFGRRTNNKLHLQFLKDLAEFGMKERVNKI